MLSRASCSLLRPYPRLLLRRASSIATPSTEIPLIDPPEPIARNYVSDGHVDPDPQIGDYPNLPFDSNQLRAPRGFWDQQDRRNFSEKLHENDEVLSVWGPDIHNGSPYKALARLTLMLTVVSGFACFQYYNYPRSPAIPRTYPFDGLKEDLGEKEGDVKPRGANTEALTE